MSERFVIEVDTPEPTHKVTAYTVECEGTNQRRVQWRPADPHGSAKEGWHIDPPVIGRGPSVPLYPVYATADEAIANAKGCMVDEARWNAASKALVQAMYGDK